MSPLQVSMSRMQSENLNGRPHDRLTAGEIVNNQESYLYKKIRVYLYSVFFISQCLHKTNGRLFYSILFSIYSRYFIPLY